MHLLLILYFQLHNCIAFSAMRIHRVVQTRSQSELAMSRVNVGEILRKARTGCPCDCIG